MKQLDDGSAPDMSLRVYTTRSDVMIVNEICMVEEIRQDFRHTVYPLGVTNYMRMKLDDIRRLAVSGMRLGLARYERDT
jgi:hypothetical protein